MMEENEVKEENGNTFFKSELDKIKTFDAVNKPEHYTQGTFEVIDEMLLVFGPAKTYDFCVMNAWKYRSRAPYKNNLEQDMAKADAYLEMANAITRTNKCSRKEVSFIKTVRRGRSHGSD